MGNNSRFSPDLDAPFRPHHRGVARSGSSPLQPWLPSDPLQARPEGAILTSGTDGSLPTTEGGADSRANGSLSATPAEPVAIALIASDPLSLAFATGTSDPRPPLETVDPSGVNLDAIDSPYPFGRCSCPACNASARTPEARLAATTLSGTATAAPTAAASLQTLADYLTTGYWQEAGTYSRKYNLTSSGTGAKSGVITYNLTGWTDDANGLSLDRQALTREVFKLYSATLGIDFKEVTGAAGDIRFTDNDGGAYAYTAGGWYANSSKTAVTIDYGVVNIEAAWYDGKSNYNTYTPQTVFHEIGHALGLGHQGQYNYTGTQLSYGTSAQFANDSWQATMMSYWNQTENTTTGSSFAWLQTPMSVDWIALNDLYSGQGFSTTKAFRGDTIYGVNTTITAAVSQVWNLFSTYAGSTAYTLVDGDGYDKLDLSNYSANQLINLAPSQPGSSLPSLSNIGGKVGNLSIAAGTIIEAATGGIGADSFYGNDVANTFRGNAGNDSFYDSLGSDIYFGDAGTDSLYFSQSIDLFSYALSGDSLLFSRRSGSGDTDQVWNGLENVSFNNVTYTYDQLVQSLSGSSLPTVTIGSANSTLISGAATNSTSLNFSGSLSQALSADQSIGFYRDGLQVGTATPTTSGATTWSFSRQEATGNNNFSYTARVLATGGQAGTLSSAFLLTVDTVAPQISVDALDTFDTTPLLSGTVNDGNAKVTVRIGGLTRTALNDGAGRWSLQWNDILAAGQTYDVAATALDAAGNSASDSSNNELIVRADDYAATSSSTGLVLVGSGSSGVLEQIGDRDWFAVDLQAGRTYDLRLNGTSLADPSLRLLNAAGTLLASNDDSSSSNLNSLITYTPSSGGRHYLEAAAFNDGASGGYTVSATDMTSVASPLFFSLANAVTTSSAAVMGGLTAQTNDIIAFDGSRFSTWLNGNANGLVGAVLRDFDIINNNEVVVAFNASVTLAGITFDDSDLAKLTRTQSGFAISMFFDGSDVGLTTSGEAIDAVTGLPNGSWLISTRGGGGVSGVSNFAAEDLVRFTPTALGTNTAGSWSLYADMSDVGISSTAENITALDVASNGRILFATQGNVSAPGLSASNEDVVGFLPASLGATTSGTFSSPLSFDGSLYGLGANALQGLDLPI